MLAEKEGEEITEDKFFRLRLLSEQYCYSE